VDVDEDEDEKWRATVAITTSDRIIPMITTDIPINNDDLLLLLRLTRLLPSSRPFRYRLFDW